MMTGMKAGGSMSEAVQSKTEDRPVTGKVFFREGLFRHSFAWFLAALALLLVTSPAVEHWQNGVLIESVLLSLVMLFAVQAIGGRRSRLIWGIVLLTPALAGKWVSFWCPDFSRRSFSSGRECCSWGMSR